MATLTAEDWVLQILRIASVALYTTVGVLVLRRHPPAEARLANTGFALWWLGLAFLGLMSLPTGFGWNLAESGLAVWRVWIYFLIPVIYVALAGLLYYLLYLYTGRRGLYKAVIGFYVLMTGLLVWLVEGGRPYLTTGEDGEAVVEFAREMPDAVGLAWALALLLPVLAAAIAYGALFFRTREREGRYRIALVSGGIILWFLFSLVNTVLGFGQDAEPGFVEQVVSQGVGLLAATMALLAFAPPPRVRRWFRHHDRKGVPS